MGLFKKILFHTFFSVTFCMSGFADDIQMDPQTRHLLDQLNAMNIPPMESVPLEEMRKTISAYALKSNVELASIKDLNVPVENGDIPVRIYTPFGSGPFPVFVYFHGGGWIFGDIEQNDDFCRQIASQANIIVVSVGYRLAPEFKYPTGIKDCYTATLWVSKNIQDYNGQPGKIAIGGDSAGGNLSAVVAMLSRKNKDPLITAQVLIYPVLSDRLDTSSFKKYGEGYYLTTVDMLWMWNTYLDYPHKRYTTHPSVSPLYAKGIKNLPPTMIVAAHFDPLADDGIDYAEKLTQHGVPVIYKDYPSIHVFVSMADQLEIGKQAVKDISEYLKAQLYQ